MPGGSVHPTKANLEGLAQAYELPLDQLYALAYFSDYLKERTGLSPEHLGIVDLFNRLSLAKQQVWTRIGEDLLTLPD